MNFRAIGRVWKKLKTYKKYANRPAALWSGMQGGGRAGATGHGANESPSAGENGLRVSFVFGGEGRG